MRRLTRPEIEACGSAMPEILRFHDALLGTRLKKLRKVPASGEYPAYTLLIFDDGSVLAPRFDDENNPESTEWEVVDREGYIYRPVEVQDLKGHTVTGFGYFHDPDNDQRPAIPYFEISGFHVCCMTRFGGGVILHQRPDGETYNLLCQINPKL
jgi:hypothetical protein